MSLCSVSVDLDGIGHYAALHGVPEPKSHGGLSVALERFDQLCGSESLRSTLFVIGADLADADYAAELRVLAERGHELANHSLDHLYDLTLRSRAEMRAQVADGIAAIE